jgi:hypothetical protein
VIPSTARPRTDTGCHNKTLGVEMAGQNSIVAMEITQAARALSRLVVDAIAHRGEGESDPVCEEEEAHECERGNT